MEESRAAKDTVAIVQEGKDNGLNETMVVERE